MRALIIVCVVLFISACSNTDWRTASREPANIATPPSEDNRAIIEFLAGVVGLQFTLGLQLKKKKQLSIVFMKLQVGK